MSRGGAFPISITSFIVTLTFSILFLAVSLAPAADTPAQLLAAGRVDDAIVTLEQRIAARPTDVEAYNLLCRAHFMLDDWDAAVSACERARNLDPRNSFYHLWLGRAYGEKADRSGFLSAAGLVKKVRTSFEQAVELDPKNWQARTDLAQFYLEAPGIVGGGKEKAQAQADVIMALNPAMAHWVMARIAEKNKDAVQAEREYRAAIAASHSGSRAWLDLAIFLRHANRLDEMDSTLNTLESSTVDRHESLMDGASLLLQAGRDYPLGVRLLQRYFSVGTVEEGPAFKAHDLFGRLLERQNDRHGAVEHFRAALALAHSYTRAQDDLKRVER
jgi:tetratricopeptide (TPR) repeat protein